MYIFSVYAKKSDESEIKDLAFVCDKFSYLAFCTGPLLLFFHGLWKNFAAYLMIFFILLQVLYSEAPDSMLGYLLGMLVLNFYVGLSFNSWMKDKLSKNGYKEFSTVVACSELEAKVVFYRENPSILQKFKDTIEPDETKANQKKATKYW